jgi:hypothetical protein
MKRTRLQVIKEQLAIREGEEVSELRDDSEALEAQTEDLPGFNSAQAVYADSQRHR